MIHITKHSGIYTLKAKQTINTSLSEAWDFFSSPKNLNALTPPEMSFEITSQNTEKMYAGQIISYKVGIFPRIKSPWVTEITHVSDKQYFTDEQRIGPYALWHHEHIFVPREQGLTIIDKISYKVPFGFLGRWLHFLLIKRKLIRIFSYRQEILKKKFG